MRSKMVQFMLLITLLWGGLEGVVLIMKPEAEEPLTLGRAARYLSVYQGQKMLIYEKRREKYRLRPGEPVFIIGTGAGEETGIESIIDFRDVTAVNVRIYGSCMQKFGKTVFTDLTCISSLRKVDLVYIEGESITDISDNRSEKIYWERILKEGVSSAFYSNLWDLKGEAVNRAYGESLKNFTEDSCEDIAREILSSELFEQFMASIFSDENLKEYFVEKNRENEFVVNLKK